MISRREANFSGRGSYYNGINFLTCRAAVLLDGNSQENDSDSLIRRSADEEGDRGHIPYACASFPGLLASCNVAGQELSANDAVKSKKPKRL